MRDTVAPQFKRVLKRFKAKALQNMMIEHLAKEVPSQEEGFRIMNIQVQEGIALAECIGALLGEWHTGKANKS